jgi:hypothetical protein
MSIASTISNHGPRDSQADHEVHGEVPKNGGIREAADQFVAESGMIREWILSAVQLKLVSSAQAEIRQALPELPGGIVAEISTLLAAIDTHLNGDPPSAIAISQDLARIAEQLRMESPEIGRLRLRRIRKHIRLVTASLGTNLQRERT